MRGRVLPQISFPKFIARCHRLMFSLRHDAQLFFFVIDQRIRRHTLHEKDVAADSAARADHRFAAEHGRVWVDGHIVLHFRMTLAALFDLAVLVFLKTARAERDAMIKFHARTDFGSLADYDAGPVIDEEMRSNFGRTLTRPMKVIRRRKATRKSFLLTPPWKRSPFTEWRTCSTKRSR